MPQIDPKFTFWFGVWTNILALIAGLSVEHAPAVIAQYAPDVQWCLGVFVQANGYILTALAGLSSSKAGPLISVPVAAVKSIVVLAAVVTALLIFGGDAQAQSRPAQNKTLNLPLDPLHLNGTPQTGDVSKDLQALWQKIVSASNADLQYASALAGASNTSAGKVRKQCWDAIVALNEQANGANLKNPDGTPMARPDPHLFTDVETLAEVIDNLSPQGPLFTSCAGAAELAKTSVFNFIAAAIGGAAGLAAMPVVPGL